MDLGTAVSSTNQLIKFLSGGSATTLLVDLGGAKEMAARDALKLHEKSPNKSRYIEEAIGHLRDAHAVYSSAWSKKVKVLPEWDPEDPETGFQFKLGGGLAPNSLEYLFMRDADRK